MLSVLNSVDTGHGDIIHDAEVDYYGLRLATCSSDNSVKVFDIKYGTTTLIEDLKGHFGPVWQVAWSHPKFGNLLASCSYDRRVIIWRETSGKWGKYYEYANHDSSVNSVRFAPPEYGLMLACGSSDGSISILTYKPEINQWDAHKLQNAHAIGCNAVDWAPAIAPATDVGTASDGKKIVKRLVSGGCDNLVKIWGEVEEDRWIEESKLEVHSDWVRDVAWAPSVGLHHYTIASCSQDRRVIIWESDDGLQWDSTVLSSFDDVVWNVSWSLNGNILAVSGGENKITLWKQNIQGSNNWQCISNVKDNQQPQN